MAPLSRSSNNRGTPSIVIAYPQASRSPSTTYKGAPRPSTTHTGTPYPRPSTTYTGKPYPRPSTTYTRTPSPRTSTAYTSTPYPRLYTTYTGTPSPRTSTTGTGTPSPRTSTIYTGTPSTATLTPRSFNQAPFSPVSVTRHVASPMASPRLVHPNGISTPMASPRQVGSTTAPAHVRIGSTTAPTHGDFRPCAAKVIGVRKRSEDMTSVQTQCVESDMTGAGNIQNLLSNRAHLKEVVVRAFKAVTDGQKRVDINGLLVIRTDIATELGVPESIFGTMDDEYIRFDFNGTGFLEANDVYKLIKWHLYDHVKAQDAAAGRITIPTKSMQLAGYTIMKELGVGNTASVQLCCDKFGNERCIKVFPKASMQSILSVQELQEEFETMKLLACRNIARTFEMFQDSSSVYMVNEVYHGGDFTKLSENATAQCGSLSENWWKDVFRQCLDGLVFMHQQAMMHCDVKEPNLMMRTTDYTTPEVVLIDFGVSKAMTAKDDGMVSGTPGYMPPETMNVGKWYPGGDVFSLGVVIFQMMTGNIPDDEAAKKGAPMIGLFLEGCTTMDHVTSAINTRKPPVHTMQASPALQQLTKRMLEKNLRVRPKAPAILKDPWFDSLDPTKNTEPAMGAEHPLATVGITEEMLAGA